MEFEKLRLVGGYGKRRGATRLTCTMMQLALLAAAFCCTAVTWADGGSRNLPGIDHEQIYKVPDNLKTMDTAAVKSLRSARQKDLESLRNGTGSKKNAEQHMFEQLMAHDEVRLTIIDVIPQLIEEYAIEGKFKNTLMGYRSTFAEEITASRETVHGLQDYQSYDFRFTAVYMSMLFAFQEFPDFYQKLKTDMNDDNTSIGRYRKSLDESFVRVEQARQQMDVYHNADDLENVIAELDQELARRNQ